MTDISSLHKPALIALALLAVSPAFAAVETNVAPPGVGATTTFLTVLPGETITINFSEPQTWFGFYWIDIGHTNLITFHGAQDTTFNYLGVSGEMLLYDSRFVSFIFTGPSPTDSFTSVLFTTSAENFYIGNISTTPPVPEPATWAMMLIGFAGLGFAFRRSRRRNACDIAGNRPGVAIRAE
jgi:hypothetical protein